MSVPSSNSIKNVLYQRLPVFKWAPQYNSQKLINDVIAGVTVALTVMPQALAYATLGGLQPQYGLYSSFLGCFIYIIFGSCKDITIGPTALMALMTYQQIHHRNPDYAVLLCFLSGVVQLLMAVLNLGILVDFISIPVTVGFTSATSVIIATSQLKALLGLKFNSSEFFDTLVKVYKNIHNVRTSDCILSFVCIVILILLKKLKDLSISKNKMPTKMERYVSNMIWIVSTSRNALVVIVSSIIAYFFIASDMESPFLLTGSVKPGMPEFKIPPFSTIINNRTVQFNEMVNDLGTSIFLVPVIAVLGNVAIAKAFASGQSVCATQELLTLSLTNMFGSFFSSMPVTGSFSRSAVNHASGVQTPFGGFYTGIMVIMALSFLTPYFAYIPKSSLAAVIICAVIFMIEYEVVKPMWKSSKKDLIPTFVTFILCLVFGVEYGILIGVAVNMLFLLYASARPSIKVEKLTSNEDVEYILVTPGSSLYFPAIDFIKSSIRKAGHASSHLPVVVDCRFILGADFTAAKGIEALIKEFKTRRQPLHFLNPQLEVISVFKGVLATDFLYFTSIDEMHTTLRAYDNNTMVTEGSRLLTHTANSTSSDNDAIIIKIRETDLSSKKC